MNKKIKDVKTEDQDTSTDNTATAEVDTQTSEKPEDSYEENYGDGKRDIPYAVFKQRNEKLRETEKKLKQMEANLEKKIAERETLVGTQYKNYYEGEIAKLQSQKQNDYEDYDYSEVDDSTRKYQEHISQLENKLSSLEGSISKINEVNADRDLKAKVSGLKELYPSMVPEVVFAMHKLQPGSSLDELAQFSHETIENQVKSKYESLIERKKEAAKKKIVGPETMSSFKPKDKPKNLRDAHDQVLELMKQYGG
jgi:hypothetical protein